MFKLFLCFSVVLLISCNERNRVLADFMDKQIEFPDDICFISNCTDTVDVDLTSYPYKIVLYIDSVGCTSCKMQLKQYAEYINILPHEVIFLIFVHPRRVQDVYYTIKRDSFPYPLCIDRTDEFNRLNHLPDDERFRCFLLDENNRVVLIGNPVQNPKIKELYIKTICERLNIDYKAEKQSNPRIHLGNISKNETKTVQFEIKNSDKEVLEIDSVYTSCECTTAKISKTEILKNESAILTVTYKPDGIGDFYREIFVKIHDEEKTKIYEIEGNSTEI